MYTHISRAENLRELITYPREQFCLANKKACLLSRQKIFKRKEMKIGLFLLSVLILSSQESEYNRKYCSPFWKHDTNARIKCCTSQSVNHFMWYPKKHSHQNLVSPYFKTKKKIKIKKWIIRERFFINCHVISVRG